MKEPTIHFIGKINRHSILEYVYAFIIDTDFDHQSIITMVITDSISIMILLLSFINNIEIKNVIA